MSNPIASETEQPEPRPTMYQCLGCGEEYAIGVKCDLCPPSVSSPVPSSVRSEPASDPSGKGAAYEWLLSNSRNEDPDFLKPAAKLLEQFAASLRQQLSDSQAELKQWSSWGIVEIAVRNQSVADYIEHWEGRTLKAEGKVSQLEADLESTRDLIPHPGDGSCDHCGCIPSIDIPTSLCDECRDGVKRAEAAESQVSVLTEELEELRGWKDSARVIIGRWDKVFEYVRTHGGRLGYDGSAETLRILEESESRLSAVSEVVSALHAISVSHDSECAKIADAALTSYEKAQQNL